MGRAERITRAIQGHDYKLYCERDTAGKLCIYRNSHRVETYFLDDLTVIHSVRPSPHFVCALTHDWRASGTPVEWGIEPIMVHIKESDLWNRDFVSDLEKQEEKHAASVARDRKNSMESFLYDYRDSFKKTFDDVNTANMDKKKQINHFNKE